MILTKGQLALRFDFCSNLISELLDFHVFWFGKNKENSFDLGDIALRITSDSVGWLWALFQPCDLTKDAIFEEVLRLAGSSRTKLLESLSPFYLTVDYWVYFLGPKCHKFKVLAPSQCWWPTFNCALNNLKT